MRKGKLFLFISILTIIFLFGTAALIDRCTIFSGSSIDEEEKKEIEEETTEKEVEPEEEVREETPEDKIVEETSGEEDADENKEETEEEEPKEEEPQQESQAPTIDLVIYDGPTYSEDDDVCYLRVEAIVTGNPIPTVSFSKDDSGGSWGPLKTQINLNSPTDTYTLTATATNPEGTATDSIELSWGCSPATKGGNSNPNINFINITGGTPLYWPDSKYDINAIAEDPDGDNLSFEWSVTGGWIDGIYDNPTVWNTPDSGGTYVLTASVDDGNGGTDSYTKSVFISETQLVMPPLETTGSKNLQAYEVLSGIIFCDQGVHDTPYGEIWIGDTDINEVILTYISFIGIDSLDHLENVTITDASLIMNVYEWIGHPDLAGDQIFVQAADYGTSLEFEDQNFGGGRTLGTINNSPGLTNINFTSPELINEIQIVLDDPVRHYVQLRLFPDGVNWNYFSDYYKIMWQTVYLHIEYTYTDEQ